MLLAGGAVVCLCALFILTPKGRAEIDGFFQPAQFTLNETAARSAVSR